MHRHHGRDGLSFASVRIAVVGGSGFVGRHLVRQLLDSGFAVINVDRSPPAKVLPREEIAITDLTNAAQFEPTVRALGRVDAVAWLAATIRQRTSVDETALEDLALMVEAPVRLLRALDHAPASFVNMSSVQVYGAPVHLPIDEDHPKDPFTAYGVAKLYAERVLDICGNQRGTAVASLRVAFVYGPGQHSGNVLPRFIREVKQGRAPLVHGSGADLRDDVYVADVARAVQMALEQRARGSFNVASGRPHTLRDVALAVCALGPPGLSPRHDSAPSNWVDRWYLADRAREGFGFTAETSFDSGVRAMWDAGEPA
jgi:UDP-glucose 4-epimerase